MAFLAYNLHPALRMFEELAAEQQQQTGSPAQSGRGGRRGARASPWGATASSSTSAGSGPFANPVFGFWPFGFNNNGDGLRADWAGDGGTRGGPGRHAFFQPRFERYETEDKHVIQGVVPGVALEDINIEFAGDALNISGKYHSKKFYGSCGPCGKDDSKGAADEKAAGAHAKAQSDKGKQAGVEEDVELVDADDGGTPPESLAAEKATEAGQVGHRRGGRRGACERSGAFSHSFSFDGPVDADNITASLNNGVLEVVVPKVKPVVPVARRIEVSRT